MRTALTPRQATRQRQDAGARLGQGGADPAPARFDGWRVVAAAFVLAAFGWGLGFYGPPVFLHAVREARGWSLPTVSLAITLHFLFGAVVVANLARLYARFGLPRVTKAGALLLACGVCGWAVAREPWQLFLGALLSGAGWVTLSAAAVNAVVSPWFRRRRPAALAMAYNGASIGGVVFSPLWVAAIGAVGFPAAALAIGVVMVAVIWLLADRWFSLSPEALGQRPDGDAIGAPGGVTGAAMLAPLPGRQLWRDRRFLTLAAAMACGLFAQIGLLAHLFALLAVPLGAQPAGLVMGIATGAAIAGRSLLGWLMPAGADRRLVACLSYGGQIIGSLALLAADGSSLPLLLAGVLLFGAGIGNATSLPPLIAQAEFAPADVARVVPLIVAISQGAYAFAPAGFGLLQALAPAAAGAAPAMFAAAALIQAAAIAAMLLGRPGGGTRALA